MNYELRIIGVKGKELVIQYCFVHGGHFSAPIIIDGEHKGMINRGVHGERRGCRFMAEERVEELAQVQKRFEKHFDMQIGALGSRWGIKTEESFRAAAEGILSEDFGLTVERYEDYDELGEAFGRPETIEIDLLIRDGKTTAIEIESSMSKYDVYAFGKKVAFYEKRHQVKVDRKLIITPMLDPRATDLVKSLRMKVYTSSYAWGDEEVG